MADHPTQGHSAEQSAPATQQEKPSPPEKPQTEAAASQPAAGQAKDSSAKDAPAQQTTAASKVWIIHPSHATLLSCAIVLIITTLWVFLLGFMAGKGQNPHKKFQQLTGGDTSPAIAATQQASPAAKDTKPDVAARATASVRQPSPSISEGTQTHKPATSVSEKKNPEKPLPPSPQYAFVYQIAAFKAQDEDKIANLRKRLKDNGYRTTAEKRGNLRFVLLHLRGTDEDVAAMQTLCQQLKLGQPLLRTRTNMSTRSKQ